MSLQAFSQQFADLIFVMQHNMLLVLSIIAVLWLITLVNSLVGYIFNVLGIIPRNIFGLPGILLSPLLHGNFTHLFFNTIPLFLLLHFILIPGPEIALLVTLSITILSGSATWLFGRKAIHVGASSVIMGYIGYLLVNAYYHPSVVSILVVFVILYYFSGFLLDLIPNDEKVSWEGHLFGFLAGIATVYLLPILLQISKL